MHFHVKSWTKQDTHFERAYADRDEGTIYTASDFADREKTTQNCCPKAGPEFCTEHLQKGPSPSPFPGWGKTFVWVNTW